MENTMYIVFSICITIIVISMIYYTQKNKIYTKECYNFRRVNKELDEYIDLFFIQRLEIEKIKGQGTFKNLSIEKNVTTVCYDITMNTMKALLHTDFYNTISMYINKGDITDVIYGKIYNRMKIVLIANQKEIYEDR